MRLDYENEASELLWKYIVQCREAANADSMNFIVRTSLDPQELAELIPLVDTVHSAMRAAEETPASNPVARERLLAEIQAERAAPKPKKAWFPVRKRGASGLRWSFTTLLLLLLLLLAALAAGYAYHAASRAGQCGLPARAAPPPPLLPHC